MTRKTYLLLVAGALTFMFIGYVDVGDTFNAQACGAFAILALIAHHCEDEK